MLRVFLLPSLLIALSGCLAHRPVELAIAPKAMSIKKCTADCDLSVTVGAFPPRGGAGPGDNDCSAVTFTLDGQKFDALEISKGRTAVLNFNLDSNAQRFAFFGSDPVTLYNEDKTGPENRNGLVRVDRVSASSFRMTIAPNNSGRKDQFHFGVALGTRNGGCAGDPKVINGS